MTRTRLFEAASAAGRMAVLGAALAVAGAPAVAAQEQAEPAAETAGAPAITRASYNQKKGALLIIGTGFDDQAVVRVNGVEVHGERKFRADRSKLRIKIPASSLQLKAQGENRVEILQGGVSSGEITF